MGADKWAQVRDPAWYDGSIAARDAAVAGSPRVLVAPRPGFDVVGANALELPEHLRRRVVVRGARGQHHLIAPECRPARERRAALIVDGNNVIGSRPDGWWRDRPGAARRLDRGAASARRAQAATASRSCSTAGRSPTAPKACTTACSSRTRPAPGRDAADDRIVEEVERDRDPASLVVVTSDRGLADRVRALGATVEGAGSLLAQLDEVCRLTLGDRHAGHAVVALHAHRVQRHRHEVVLPDGEHEVEQLLLVVARRELARTSRR